MGDNSKSKQAIVAALAAAAIIFTGLYMLYTSKNKKKQKKSADEFDLSSQQHEQDVNGTGDGDNTIPKEFEEHPQTVPPLPLSPHDVPSEWEKTKAARQVTEREATALAYALKTSSVDSEMLLPSLTTIINAAAFTESQDLLRDAGCLGHLRSLLSAHVMALQVGHQPHVPVIVGISTAINNLAVNQQNQTHLKDCIPSLIDLATLEESSEKVQLAALEALTNLALTDSHHPPYTRLIQQLYAFLHSENPAVRMQALRLLNNLSTNPDMVPHLLAAKAPGCVLDFLDPRHISEQITLRWLTMLANVVTTARKLKVTCATLPTEYKAPSPETMYAALYGQDSAQQLKSKVFVLSKSGHEEIRQHATRLYTELHEIDRAK